MVYLKYRESTSYPSKWGMVMIKSDERNRGHWKFGIVEELS